MNEVAAAVMTSHFAPESSESEVVEEDGELQGSTECDLNYPPLEKRPLTSLAPPRRRGDATSREKYRERDHIVRGRGVDERSSGPVTVGHGNSWKADLPTSRGRARPHTPYSRSYSTERTY